MLGTRNTLTITAGLYTDGDVLGGRQYLALPDGTNTVRLNRIIITDAVGQNAVLRVHFYNAMPVDILDNAAYVRSDADVLLWQFHQDISSYVDHGSITNSTSAFENIDAEITCPTGILWYYLVINDVSPPTYVAITDISITIGGISR